MQKITLKKILSWNPCYGEAESRRRWLRAFPTGKATPHEVARTRRLLAGDRLWVLLRDEVLPAAILREFAADCAHRALDRYGGRLTADQLTDCYGAAGLAALEAAGAEIGPIDRAAAEAAAGAAAGAAARDAAWAAANAAAWAAARDAARNAAWAAARDAARNAAGAAAREAASAAAREGERRAQVAHLAETAAAFFRAARRGKKMEAGK